MPDVCSSKAVQRGLARRPDQRAEKLHRWPHRARGESNDSPASEAYGLFAALVKSRLNAIASQIEITGNLGDVLRVKPRNGWSARCDNADGGIPVLSLSAVTGYRYRNSGFKRTSLYAPLDGHFWLKPGDLLITRSNTPELVGHAAIYDGTPSPCIYPDLMMRLEPTPGLVDLRFVWYWLQSSLVRKFIAKKAKGTSPTMKKISQGIVMAIPFPSTIPIPEQRRIVVELDTLQAQLDALELPSVRNSSRARCFCAIGIVEGIFRCPSMREGPKNLIETAAASLSAHKRTRPLCGREIPGAF
jgi:hypothetical protein